MSNVIKKRFAFNVIYLRNRKGLTQTELASQANTTQNLISMIEGMQNVCLCRCNDVAFSLGYHLSDLLENDYYPPDWRPPARVR